MNRLQGTLVARHLKKAYGRREIVRDVSFEVSPGEVVGLLGANGAGKSTCFQMVAGLLRSDGGTIHLGNESLERLPLYQRARRGLGYLPQEPTVFRALSAHANLLIALEARPPKIATHGARADSLLQQFHLSHVRETPGAQLSGGERRRLELARALAHRPKILLLDEPFAGVDPIAVAEMQMLIRQVSREGIGILLTDHNVRETLGIVDRAYLMAQGELLVQGSATDIVESKEAREQYLGEAFSL